MSQESVLPDVRVFEHLALVSRLLESSVNQALVKQQAITLEEFSVLAVLGGAPAGFLHMTELSAVLGTSRSRVSQTVARQQSRGRVIRSECPTDARAAHVMLTERGRALLRDSGPVYEEAVRSRLGAFTDDARRLTVLAEALQSIVGGLRRTTVGTACTRRRTARAAAYASVIDPAP
ncbi:MarR family winged helix-turn-helix transcriptional regulator [Streptomyces spongiae]|uniref:MarR family winged helix-turn-helix transcriptional regulator n=1 Tax=Streptomyces spongiae TaxID=565072 RepID=UPI001883F499|nr:MarR family winged helix-turn-helix transcriptional regulator [Streptomyces spongiae]